jgi:hypothetical protein
MKAQMLNMLLSLQYVSADVIPPVTTKTTFWEKSLKKKTLGSKIHGFNSTIRQESPCGKIRLWHILKTVASIDNFIRTQGLDIDISVLFFWTLGVNMKICHITLKVLPQGVKGVI